MAVRSTSPARAPRRPIRLQGVFLASRGATTATVIDNSTDTRVVSIANTGSGNQLYVSRDYNPPGSGTAEFHQCQPPDQWLRRLAHEFERPRHHAHLTPPASPFSSGGNNGSINLTASLANGVNNCLDRLIRLSEPGAVLLCELDDALCRRDSGQPKNGNANKAALGEGGPRSGAS